VRIRKRMKSEDDTGEGEGKIGEERGKYEEE
jgi:hypothetical protein